MNVTEEQVAAGQAVYTKLVLRAYDLVVLGVSNRFIWKCPTQRLLEHYNLHVSANHADVGVGTGYFLDKCRFPSPTPRIALIDLNQNTLDFASRRIVAGELGAADTAATPEMQAAAKARVARDIDSARVSGVRFTPTFFVNGRRYDGAWDESSFTDAMLGTLGYRVRIAALSFAAWAPSGCRSDRSALPSHRATDPGGSALTPGSADAPPGSTAPRQLT